MRSDGAPTAGLHELYARYRLDETRLPRRPRAATGAAVIVREDGLMLSNHHVVAGASHVRATLWDGRRIEARVLATDARTDVAVLDLDGEGYPAARLGDSAAARPGQPVLAVGHPYEFPFTVTTGIISAVGRRGLDPGEIEDYLQTDAAIAPGASGGPLFDETGALLGLNTSIYTGDDAGQVGIAFAVPIALAWRVAGELMADGRPDRPFFGLSAVDAREGGARLTAVRPDGPAARAGLATGDRVLTVDGQAVTGAADLAERLKARPVGGEVSLGYARGEAHGTARLTAINAELPSPVEVALPPDGLEWAGLTLAPVTVERVLAWGLPPERLGLLVLAAAPEGPGDAAGLVPGDVIYAVQGAAVADGPALRAAADGRGVAMVRYWRGEGTLLAAVGGLDPRYQR